MSVPSSSVSDETFASLGVPAPMVAALDREGITSPFEIQVATIPDALDGRDVLGRAPTGSGKTLAFGIPMLAGLQEGRRKYPRGLILSPTRELAEQIRRELQPLAASRGRSILTIYGGVGFGNQLKGLRAGVDLLVACPGRLEDLISQGEVSLSEVDSVVVDEADRMADMGFLPAVRRILDLTAKKRQTVLFSATLDKEVKVLIDNYQHKPVTHQVGDVEPDLSTVEHRFILAEKTDKLRLAADLIDDAGPTMIFCRTRHGVDRVARQLKRAGVKAGWIHGGRSQNQRDAALVAFTNNKVQALVATDVAARGIHVDGVARVIHYDPPADHKDYIHRSGRTARAGAGGSVVSFVDNEQRKAVGKLIKMVGLPPTDFEAMPELRERETPKWVEKEDQGRGDSRRPRNGSGQKRSNGSKQRANKRAGQTRQDRGSAGASSHEGGSQETSGDDRPARSNGSGNGGRTRPSGSKPGSKGGPGKRGGKANASKRSGKPRPKARRSGGGAKSSSKPSGPRSDG